MTLIFGTIVAFAAGLAFGRRWYAFALAGLAWYSFLAVQTAYLAYPGRTAFGGENALKTIQGGLYWLVQPPLLALSIGLLLAGAFLHQRISAWGGLATR
jgi:hypothetical protein